LLKPASTAAFRPQMSTHCTCCHLCHVSMKQRPRQLLACSDCNAILCRTCLETRWRTNQWLDQPVGWVCHKCRGDCPCKSCKGRSGTRVVGHKRASFSMSATEEEDQDFTFAQPSRGPKTSKTRTSKPSATERAAQPTMQGLLMLLEQEEVATGVASPQHDVQPAGSVHRSTITHSASTCNLADLLATMSSTAAHEASHEGVF